MTCDDRMREHKSLPLGANLQYDAELIDAEERERPKHGVTTSEPRPIARR
jgi:hypothetical protein